MENAHPSKLGNPASQTCHALQPPASTAPPLPSGSHRHLQDHMKNRFTFMSDTHRAPLCIYWVCQVTFEINQIPPTGPHVSTLTCSLPSPACHTGQNQAGTSPSRSIPAFWHLFKHCAAMECMSPECQSLSLSHHLAEMVWFCAHVQLLTEM